MTCRTCKYLDVAPNKAGRIVPLRLYTYHCNAIIPPWRDIALAATVPSSGIGDIQKVRMRPDDGAGCPAYASRKPA